MLIASQFVPAAEYVPRRPHDTVLYRIVREELARFFAHTERTYAAPLPKYVIDTFEHLVVASAGDAEAAGACLVAEGDCRSRARICACAHIARIRAARTRVVATCVAPSYAEPTSITVAHWGRLDDGELFAKTRYVDWAVRMKRSFGLDVLRCPRCTHKMRVLATITQPETVRRILLHLGVRADPLACAPARDPPWEQIDLGLDAGAV